MRALLLVLGLAVGQIMPPEPPAYNILVYFAAYFLLALPFLGLRARTLFIGAGVFLVAGPVLLHLLGGVLPELSSFNPTVATLITEPAAVLSQLLLTGTCPALPYMAYMLAGMAVVGACQFLARRHSTWLAPLAAVGAMTLTLYTAHLVFLSFQVFCTHRLLWLVVSLVLSVLFAVAWQRALGTGPVERVMNAVVRPVRAAVRQTARR